MPPVMSLKQIRVGSVHDLSAMEAFMVFHNVPVPYIETISSVLREYFESQEIGSGHRRPPGSDNDGDGDADDMEQRPTAGLSLLGRAARQVLLEHIDEFDVWDIASFLDPTLLIEVLVEFLMRDLSSNM
eukprot:2764489-Pleurochrysis_carterae.AAC.1